MVDKLMMLIYDESFDKPNKMYRTHGMVAKHFCDCKTRGQTISWGFPFREPDDPICVTCGKKVRKGKKS